MGTEIGWREIKFYQNLSSQETNITDFSALDCIGSCITEEENIMLSAIPTMQEVTNNMFSIDVELFVIYLLLSHTPSLVRMCWSKTPVSCTVPTGLGNWNEQ